MTYWSLITDWLKTLLVGTTADPLQSFGILSTGVYIALVLVFPYFISFYLLLGILEDSGYLPRLAVVLDSFFHRIGLHGYSSIPVLLGLGCKVPALLATRMLYDKREKLLTAALITMSAPCLPQSAMIYSMGMHYGAHAVIAVFAILFALALGTNMVLNALIKGAPPEIFVEIPPYRVPSPTMLARKLWIRGIEYLREVLPMIVAGVMIINILNSLKFFGMITGIIGKPIAALSGLPHDIAPVMVLGFLRKDISIALLAPFHLSAAQFVIASIFMVLYVPCIASFFTLIKELGLRSAIKLMGLVFFIATVIASLLHTGVMLLRAAGIVL